MIGLDTNVLVRYLVQDDPEQARRAADVIDGLTQDQQGYVSLVTLVELYWVLRAAYAVGRAAALDTIDQLLGAAELVVDRAEVAVIGVHSARRGADFADAVIAELGRRAGCAETITFDCAAARLAGMRLVT